ncbi:MAG: agmatine deiminase family protein [Candidatus Eisenbacteria sp.]|nr:agmatine deiminase family protein [Candidatus Eisenbacteria bacterium]
MLPGIFVLAVLCPLAAPADESSPPRQGMHYSIDQLPADMDLPERGLLIPPSGSEIVCPAEFCRADGCFLVYETQWGSAPIIMDLAYEIALEDTVYMIVKNASDRIEAENMLIANGVNMDYVRFILFSQLSENSIWVRDYGPWYVCEDGAKGTVDFWYPFTNDDYFPSTAGAFFGLPVYTNGLLLSGGNLMMDGNGMAFATSIIYSYNPGYTEAQVRQLIEDYCGADSLVVLPILDVENTKHIDIFCKLVDDHTLIVGEYASPGDGAGNNYYILNEIAAFLDSHRNLDDCNFEVVRIPMPPWESGSSMGVTRTYTNSLIINDKVLVPVYGIEMDAEALSIYESLLPRHEVIGIDSEQIIHRAGAVHCITKLHHSDNPLVVLHTPVDSLDYGEVPVIRFGLNPKFADTQAWVFSRLQSQESFTEVPASFYRGEWTATLPGMEEDFEYYVLGTSVSGGVELTASLPRSAPVEYFTVDVQEPTSVASGGFGDARILSVTISPNPLTTTTEIRCTAPERGEATIAIYNVRGQEVRRFHCPDAGPKFAIPWDGTDDRGDPVATGIYVCRVQVAGEVGTAKLLILR